MESPFCDGNATLIDKETIIPYRKESFKIIRKLYKCETTGMEFSTEEQDQDAVKQVYDQYRVKHLIPFPEDLIRLRKNYSLSSTKMSKILGFGINQYHNYEKGEVPSLSNARLLIAAFNKDIFLQFLEACKCTITDKEYFTIKQNIQTSGTEVAAEPFESYSNRNKDLYNP